MNDHVNEHFRPALNAMMGQPMSERFHADIISRHEEGSLVLYADYAHLERQNAALLRDAERYRWLRDRMTFHNCHPGGRPVFYMTPRSDFGITPQTIRQI